MTQEYFGEIGNNELKAYFKLLEEKFKTGPPMIARFYDIHFYAVFDVAKALEIWLNKDVGFDVKEMKREELISKLSDDFFSICDDDKFHPGPASYLLSSEVVSEMMKPFDGDIKLYVLTDKRLLDLKGNFRVVILNKNRLLDIHFWFDT